MAELRLSGLLMHLTELLWDPVQAVQSELSSWAKRSLRDDEPMVLLAPAGLHLEKMKLLRECFSTEFYQTLDEEDPTAPWDTAEESLHRSLVWTLDTLKSLTSSYEHVWKELSVPCSTQLSLEDRLRFTQDAMMMMSRFCDCYSLCRSVPPSRLWDCNFNPKKCTSQDHVHLPKKCPIPLGLISPVGKIQHYDLLPRPSHAEVTFIDFKFKTILQDKRGIQSTLGNESGRNFAAAS